MNGVRRLEVEIEVGRILRGSQNIDGKSLRILELLYIYIRLMI